ncbi:hypothetical protein D3C85_1818140 [compost metagenome]
MGQRQPRIGTVVGAIAKYQVGHLRRFAIALMGHNDALGVTGGPRREDQLHRCFDIQLYERMLLVTFAQCILIQRDS